MVQKTLLEIKNLNCFYGSIQALDDVSLNVEENEIVTLIGANGAGKSTLLMSLFSNPKPTSGQILFNGMDLTKIDSHKIANYSIAISPEGRRIFPKMNVEENLILGATSIGNKFIEEDLEKNYQFFPILKDRKHQSSGTLSGGEQQMLAIGRALMSRPKLLLLDEPSLGLAPLIVKQIFDILTQISKQGVTIFLVEQNAYQALKIANKAYVLVNGSIKMSGLAKDMLKNDEIKQAYLGGY